MNLNNEGRRDGEVDERSENGSEQQRNEEKHGTECGMNGEKVGRSVGRTEKCKDGATGV